MLCALGAVGGVALISVGGAVMISALGLLFLFWAGWRMRGLVGPPAWSSATGTNTTMPTRNMT